MGILLRCFRWVGVGVLLGSIAAAGSSRFLRSLLFGISSLDPFVFVGIAFGTLAVCALACYLPARKAAMVDPLEALRAE